MDFLQEDIIKVQEWTKKVAATIQSGKNLVMNLGRGNPALQYHTENTPLTTTEAEKYQATSEGQIHVYCSRQIKAKK